jgi:hypothetical protein
MAQIDNALDSPLIKGVLIGVGLAVLVPVAITALAPIARPLVRSALRTGAWAYEKAREGVAEFGELAQDVVAEVQEELRTEQEAATTEEPSETA